jgi:hypothetical protein
VYGRSTKGHSPGAVGVLDDALACSLSVDPFASVEHNTVHRANATDEIPVMIARFNSPAQPSCGPPYSPLIVTAFIHGDQNLKAVAVPQTSFPGPLILASVNAREYASSVKLSATILPLREANGMA